MGIDAPDGVVNDYLACQDVGEASEVVIRDESGVEMRLVMVGDVVIVPCQIDARGVLPYFRADDNVFKVEQDLLL